MSETTNNPAASSMVITDTQRLDWLIEWIDEYLNRDMPPACYMMTPDREDIDAKIRSESENGGAERTALSGKRPVVHSEVEVERGGSERTPDGAVRSSDWLAGGGGVELVRELYKALLLLGADHGLLGAVGSLGDTMTVRDVLTEVRGWVRRSAESGDYSPELLAAIGLESGAGAVECRIESNDMGHASGKILAPSGRVAAGRGTTEKPCAEREVSGFVVGEHVGFNNAGETFVCETQQASFSDGENNGVLDCHKVVVLEPANNLAEPTAQRKGTND